MYNTIIVDVDRAYVTLAGHPVFTDCQSTLADGLAVPLVGANAYATAAPLIDKIVSVRCVI
jgi:threonine dehydratase